MLNLDLRVSIILFDSIYFFPSIKCEISVIACHALSSVGYPRDSGPRMLSKALGASLLVSRFIYSSSSIELGREVRREVLVIQSA